MNGLLAASMAKVGTVFHLQIATSEKTTTKQQQLKQHQQKQKQLLKNEKKLG